MASLHVEPADDLQGRRWRKARCWPIQSAEHGAARVTAPHVRVALCRRDRLDTGRPGLCHGQPIQRGGHQSLPRKPPADRPQGTAQFWLRPTHSGYLAACVRDGYAYQRQQFYLTRPLWEPVFEPDAAMLSSIGDGAYKINQAVPGYFGEENLRDLTGIPMDNRG